MEGSKSPVSSPRQDFQGLRALAGRAKIIAPYFVYPSIGTKT